MVKRNGNSGRKESITDEMIIKMYNDKIPFKEMENITGLSGRGIRYVLNKNGVDTSKGGSRKRKHKVNEDFFKTWSHEMAWTLGMFITDGCVSQNQSIYFSQKDPRLLEIIAKYMETDSIIRKPTSTSSSSTLFIHSKEIKQDLAKMGITENKSHIAPFPNVPEEFLPSFIRGVIDGDGYVSNTSYLVIVTTGSKEFADGMLNVFQSWELSSYIRMQQNPKSDNKYYRVSVTGRKSTSKLSSIIYTHCSDDCIFYKRDRMGQHVTGKLTKQSIRRHGFQMDVEIFQEIRRLAEIEKLSIRELVENGIINMLKDPPIITKVKKLRKNCTISIEICLLQKVREFADSNDIFIGRVLEECVNYINIKELRKDG